MQRAYLPQARVQELQFLLAGFHNHNPEFTSLFIWQQPTFTEVAHLVYRKHLLPITEK